MNNTSTCAGVGDGWKGDVEITSIDDTQVTVRFTDVMPQSHFGDMRETGRRRIRAGPTKNDSEATVKRR
jgi:hypothetical protein